MAKMQSERHMAWVNPKLEMQTSIRNSLGLFSKEAISEGEHLAVFGGTILAKEEVMQLPHELRSNVLQISDGLWIGSCLPELELVDYIGHSCNPNAGLKGQILLVAMRDIIPDEEITFDYAMCISEWVGMDPIKCVCGYSQCRGIVLQDDWRLPELQKRYQGYFSLYLQEKIDAIY